MSLGLRRRLILPASFGILLVMAQPKSAFAQCEPDYSPNPPKTGAANYTYQIDFNGYGTQTQQTAFTSAVQTAASRWNSLWSSRHVNAGITSSGSGTVVIRIDPNALDQLMDIDTNATANLIRVHPDYLSTIASDSLPDMQA